jgi:hypothetical protein
MPGANVLALVNKAYVNARLRRLRALCGLRVDGAPVLNPRMGVAFELARGEA